MRENAISSTLPFSGRGRQHHKGSGRLRSVVKMTAVLLLMTSLGARADGYGQITLHEKNISLKKAFKEIKRQSGYDFLYSAELVQKAGKVSVDLVQASLEQAVEACLTGKPFTYRVVGKTVVIKPREDSLTSILSLPPVVQTADTLRGKVTGEGGQPLAGATVSVKGSNVATQTDKNGNFEIDAKSGSTLTASYVGYAAMEFRTGKNSFITLSLKLADKMADEVVVIGYGTQKRRDLTGSLTVVNQKDFNNGLTRTAADLLQGKVAGLTVTSADGDVTSQQQIRLRGVSSLSGSSSPFVVIDGVPGLSLNAVAPQDIQSISILKDASAAAIYGSRSAGGVILITTKKGKSGQSTVEYSGYIAADMASNKPPVLTAGEWRDYVKKNGIDGSSFDKGVNTDWFGQILRTGISHSHSLSIAGGNEKSNYRASLNYLNRQGVMKDNGLEQYNALVSLNQKSLNDKLLLSLTASAMQSDEIPADGGNALLAYNMIPVYPVKNPDGSWFETFDYNQGNPVHNLAENKRLNKTSLFFGNIKADLEIVKGLKAGISLFKQRDTYDNASYNAITTPSGRGDHGSASRNTGVSDKKILESTINYTKTTGENAITVLGGYSYERNDNQTVTAQSRNFISDIFGYDNLSTGNILRTGDANSSRNMNILASFFGRLNYSMHDKYIFTGTIRRDGSSVFGKNHKWGTFPSASAAWRLSSEPFLKSVKVIRELKLRVGYGITGNQSGIGPYNSIALFGRSDEYLNNGQWYNTYRYAQNDNPNLKWEQTATANAGIDFVLFEGRLNGSVDYYQKKTSDLLYTYSVPVPPFLYPTILANVGDMENKGVELSLNANIIHHRGFNWDASFNAAHNKNTVTRLSNTIYSTSSIKTGGINLRGTTFTTTSIVEEGQEVGTFYGLKCNGLDKNGKYIIADINNDGNIDNLDRTYIGHALPKLTYGISNTFSWKNLDFNFFLRGVYGNDVLNAPLAQYGNKQWLPGANVLKAALTNGLTDVPRYSSYYIEKGSFLRLDNMTLAYNFIKLHGISSLKVYVSAQNLFVIARFKGLDPETDMGGLSPGIVEETYIPKARTFSFGANIKL